MCDKYSPKSALYVTPCCTKKRKLNQCLKFLPSSLLLWVSFKKPRFLFLE